MASTTKGPNGRPDGASRAVGRRSESRALAEQAGLDQTRSDTDQTASDTDQTASDTSQTLSETDQDRSDDDQTASDQDQAAADQDQAAHPAANKDVYVQTRDDRAQSTAARERTTVLRAHTMFERSDAATKRDENARLRDMIADARDSAAEAREEAAAAYRRMLGSEDDAQGDPASRTAAQDRARAALDRARAAEDRELAARDRERALAALKESHLDDLTGFYRRAMGTVAMENEIARARRSDGRLVLAFIDVDDLKGVNDRDGHAAGDELLRDVAASLRSNLRSYDPVMRYGGDEFVCTLSSTDLDAARDRFKAVHTSLAILKHDASISVGFAALREGENLEELMGRADAALRAVKQPQQ